MIMRIKAVLLSVLKFPLFAIGIQNSIMCHCTLSVARLAGMLGNTFTIHCLVETVDVVW
jgi:hypothetical protein